MTMAQTLVYLLEAFRPALCCQAGLCPGFFVGQSQGRTLRPQQPRDGRCSGWLFLWDLPSAGGALSGPSLGWQADLIGIAQYGLLAIFLMLVAGVLCERVLLPHFDNRKEIVEDQNMGTAFVEAGMHIANGLIVLAIAQARGRCGAAWPSGYWLKWY